MRKWVRTSAKALLLTAGFVALGTGVSFADSHPMTTGNGSVLGGNQLSGNFDVPVNVCGNAVAVAGGVAGAKCEDSAAVVHEHDDDGPMTSGNGSVLGGNQGVIDWQSPINVSGNSVAGLIGTAGAKAEHTGAAVVEDGHRHMHGGGDDTMTSGNGSLVGGNQLVGDADIPINLTGNAIGAIGGTAGAASEDTLALVHEGNGGDMRGDNGDDGNGGHGYRKSQLSDQDVVEQGENALATAQRTVDGATPVVDGRHQVQHQAAPSTGGLLDKAGSTLTNPVDYQTDSVEAGPVVHQHAPAGSDNGDGGDIMTSGNGSLLGGNQLVLDGDIPINGSGNAIGAVGGVAGAKAEHTGAAVVEDSDDVMSSGNASVLGGNQAVGDLDVPVNLTGNSVAGVVGIAGAAAEDSGAAVVEHQRASEVEHTSNEVGLPKTESLPLSNSTQDEAPAEKPDAPKPEQPKAQEPKPAQQPKPEQPASEQQPEAPAGLPGQQGSANPLGQLTKTVGGLGLM